MSNPSMPATAVEDRINETPRTNPLTAAWAGTIRLSVEAAKQRTAAGLRPFRRGEQRICNADSLPFIWQGETGVGKTEGVRQMAQENDWDFAAVNFGGTDEQCNTGLPVVTERDGRKVMETALPEYLPCFNRPPQGEVGILLLDEMFSGATPQHQAFARAMLDRQVGARVMLPGWAVVGTTNPVGTMEYGLSASDDITLPNRAVVMCVHTDELETYAWWRRQGVNPPLLNFLVGHSLRKASLFRVKDPRSWWKLGLLFDAWDAGRAPPAWYVEQLQSACGEHGSAVGRAWLLWRADGDNPDNRPIPADALMTGDDREALPALLRRGEDWIKRERSDLISTTNWDVLWWFREHARSGKLPDERGWIGLAAWLNLVTCGHSGDLIESLAQTAVGCQPLQTAFIKRMAANPAGERMTAEFRRTMALKLEEQAAASAAPAEAVGKKKGKSR